MNLPCPVTHLGPDGGLEIVTETANTHIRVHVNEAGDMEGDITPTGTTTGDAVNVVIDQSLSNSSLDVTQNGDIEMQGRLLPMTSIVN